MEGDTFLEAVLFRCLGGARFERTWKTEKIASVPPTLFFHFCGVGGSGLGEVSLVTVEMLHHAFKAKRFFGLWELGSVAFP